MKVLSIQYILALFLPLGLCSCNPSWTYNECTYVQIVNKTDKKLYLHVTYTDSFYKTELGQGNGIATLYGLRTDNVVCMRNYEGHSDMAMEAVGIYKTFRFYNADGKLVYQADNVADNALWHTDILSDPYESGYGTYFTYTLTPQILAAEQN